MTDAIADRRRLPGRRRMVRRPRARTVAKLALVAPALAMFVGLYLIPVGAGVGLSLFDWNALGTPRYAGLGNYDELLSTDVFLTNIRVTLVVVGLSLATILPLSLLLAVCLSGKGRLFPLFRAILFLPVVVPLAATALLWVEIFNPTDGLANDVVGVFGIEPVTWLGDDSTALWALLIVQVWGTVGLFMVIQLSGLSAIPTELREAARLETPSSWRVFRHVVLPLLRESLSVSAALIVTGSFVYFTSLAFVMTRGGPDHSTEVLGLRAYLEAFLALDYGRATAATVISMVLTIGLVGITLAVGNRKRVEY